MILKFANVTIQVQQECNIAAGHEVTDSTAYRLETNDKTVLLLPYSRHTVKPRITNNSVYEQIFQTQSVSDDILCLELRTRKPSKHIQKQITLDNF